MRQELESLIAELVAQQYDTDVVVELTRPDAQFGDYATSVALQLAKPLGKAPRAIAEHLAEALRTTKPDIIRDVQVAGPGFINLSLTDSALLTTIHAQPAQIFQDKVVLAEYSDANPFKPLHAGHLYTTLVGDVIARILEVGGANVTRINYGGDVGLHVGKSMWAIITELGGELPEKLAQIPEAERSSWLGARYVIGNNAFEDDETSKEEIIASNRRVYEIHANQDHDSPYAQIYWTCRQWSYDHFTVLYDGLQVQQFDRVLPESEIVALGLATVREQVKTGVYALSDGAVIFKGEDYGLHTRVFINSQGLPTYEAKDVGLMLTKWRDYHFDRSLMIVANEQDQYMKVMLKSVEQFAPEPASRSEHLSHGIVKLQGGVKMSSRKGNVVSALDILEAASSANKVQSGKDDPNTVLGAVKYAFLKNRLGGDIAYDPVESVSLEGNSGPYLQYAHARARSILRKAEGEHMLAANTEFELDERSLLRKLSEYVEVIDKTVIELLPHHICTYLYELAQSFNQFYERNRVIDDPRQEVRLALVTQYAGTLQRGLQLLGITAPEQM